MKRNFNIIVLTLAVLSSCDLIKGWGSKTADSSTVDSEPIARVKEFYLYKKDITGLVPESTSSEDSASIVSQYIDSWILKQLMISKASSEIAFDKADIDRKVLDYRYALMVHDFEKYYVNHNLNKEVTAEEIEKYYDERFENFVLRQNIVRCLFAQIPKQAPQINTFRTQIRTYPNTDMEELKSYCYRFATRSSLEPELWLNFDEIISSTPLANIQDRVSFLKTNSFVESSDEEYHYYIRLLDYKISNQISPLDYIRDDIESILINKKKVELRKELEDEVYNEAKESNEFEVY